MPRSVRRLLFERRRQRLPRAVVLEGYGITEVFAGGVGQSAAGDRAGHDRQALPGVRCASSIWTVTSVLPPGQMGMLHVSGPTVFPGYIGHDGPSPFVEEARGKRWYVTGDLGEFDADGYLWFRGRLKTLPQGRRRDDLAAGAGGAIRRLYPPTTDGPRAAVEGIEHERRPAHRPVRDGAAESARRQRRCCCGGLPGRDASGRGPARGAIPVLGTGKIDYKVLRGIIAGERSAHL